MLINFLIVALISLSFSPIFSSISINNLLSFAIVPILLITRLMNTMSLVVNIISFTREVSRLLAESPVLFVLYRLG